MRANRGRGHDTQASDTTSNANARAYARLAARRYRAHLYGFTEAKKIKTRRLTRGLPGPPSGAWQWLIRETAGRALTSRALYFSGTKRDELVAPIPVTRTADHTTLAGGERLPRLCAPLPVQIRKASFIFLRRRPQPVRRLSWGQTSHGIRIGRAAGSSGRFRWNRHARLQRISATVQYASHCSHERRRVRAAHGVLSQ